MARGLLARPQGCSRPDRRRPAHRRVLPGRADRGGRHPGQACGQPALRGGGHRGASLLRALRVPGVGHGDGAA